MAVTFKGSGSVWIPATHRFVRFVDGVYSTDKADEIAVLAAKYEHDVGEIVASNEESVVEAPKRGRRPKSE